MTNIVPFPSNRTTNLERLLKVSVERAVAFHTAVAKNRNEGSPAIVAWDMPIARLMRAVIEAGGEIVVDDQGRLVIRARR